MKPGGKIVATIGGFAGDANAEQALAVVRQLAATGAARNGRRRNAQMLQHLEGMKIVSTVAGELTKRQKAAVVAVTDSYGELIALLRVGDAPLSSIRIAMNKAWTAARERQDSAAIGKASRDPQSGFDISYYGDSRYVGWGGGVPVWREGKVVGAIGVSGLPEESEDIELAELGVAALAGT